MRKWSVALVLAASVSLAACVQTKQYADLQFTPPQGDYKLLVLRPDVTVGSLTTGGMVEPRADWTDQARASIVAALRAQQAARGGKVTIIEHRNELPGVDPQELADVERLNAAVDDSIALHKYLGDYLPTKRGNRLDWTLGEDAVRLGQKTGYDYALFLHAEDQVASGGRIALGVLGLAGCIVGFCAPNVGGQQQLDYASLVDLRTGDVVWFNVVLAESQVPGIKFGDLRTSAGRRADGRAPARPDEAGPGGPPRAGGALMCLRCVEISRRSLLVGGAAAAAALHTGVAHARVLPRDMVPLVGPGFKPTDRDEQGLWKEMERAEEEIAGSNLLIQDPKLTGYLKNIIGTVGGPAAQDFRIYLARIPDFNAMMFPSGFAVVFSGLLLRMRNEAQLAGVIAHESGHFLRRHMIRSWRDERRKTDLFAVGSMLAGIGGAGAGVYLGDYVQLAELGTLLSLFSYSREMEAEADAMGARLVADAGYTPMEMSNIWLQLIGEENASAYYRRKHRAQRRAVRHPSIVGRANGRPQGRRRRSHRAWTHLPGLPRALSVDDRRDPADPARRPGQAQ